MDVIHKISFVTNISSVLLYREYQIILNSFASPEDFINQPADGTPHSYNLITDRFPALINYPPAFFHGQRGMGRYPFCGKSEGRRTQQV